MYHTKAVIGISILLICALFMVESSHAVKNPDMMINVTAGSRKIINHNIQQAKQAAVLDALNIAVQQAFISLVSKEVLASNLDFFYDKILPISSDYIVTYSVIGGIENHNHYHVGVESKIDLAMLEQTLSKAKILSTSHDKPKILFFIAEKTFPDMNYKYWWGSNLLPYHSLAETIIVTRMIKEKFIVTGYDQERPNPSFYNIAFDSISDIQAAKNLGREMNADMIIFGEASSSEAINRMGQDKTFNGRINLAGYHLETGEKVIESKISAVAKSNIEKQGNTQALSKAAMLSASDLIEKINIYWIKNLRRENVFDVNIEGDNFLSRFIALKQKLKQMPGIENLQHREIASNHAVIQIFYKGRSSQFANTLMLKTFEDFGLEISDVRDNFINIRFIEK
jgi:hypothetical protein